jgi:hypothetical protein
LDWFRAGEMEGRDDGFSRQVSSSARLKTFIHMNDRGNVHSSEDWGTHD